MEIKKSAVPPQSHPVRRGKPAEAAAALPQETVSLGQDPMARVDRLIADLRSGKIHYAPEIQAKIRQHELTLADFPCQKFILTAGEKALDSTELPTEIVPKHEKSRYKHAVTVDSNLTLKELEKDLEERKESIHDRAGDLYVQAQESLLVLLEGDNAGGKDGILKHVFSLNPQNTPGQYAAKAPTAVERQHKPDWRSLQHLPGPGQIGFHNRSAYGDVVFAAKTEQQKREREAGIREVEYGLTMGLPMTPEGNIALPDAEGKVDPSAMQRPPMRIIKVLAVVSDAEQAARLSERLLNDEKAYKMSKADVEGHPQHDQVQTDFANAMASNSLPHSPTYLIPNDNKLAGWRKLAEIVDKNLKSMDPHPPAPEKLSKAERNALAQPLLAEVQEAGRHKHHESTAH